MTVGDRIKKQRESIGISQTELAEKVKIAKQNLYKYENNVVTNIPSDKIEEIAYHLNVSPGYLMGWEKPAEDEAEKLADMVGDRKLASYMEKISQLDDADKEKIYSYIDYIISSKK